MAFKADPAKDKINLSLGAYRDENGKPYVFNIVKKVEQQIAGKNYDKEYAPIDGDVDFINGCQKFLLGDRQYQDRVSDIPLT